MKTINGMTLISLIITIIILLILAGVTISTIVGKNSLLENAENVVGQYNNSTEKEKEMLNEIENLKNGNDENELIQLEIPSKWNGSVQTPELMKGMTPVYWSTDEGVTPSTYQEGAKEIYAKIDENGKPDSKGKNNPKFNWDNWYEYVAGDNSTDTKTSRWANVVTDDGSYWVWIPRFKYKISNSPTTAGLNNAGKIDVKFISVKEKSGETVGDSTYTTNKESFTVGNMTTYEFITRDEENYIIHPVFEDGSTSGSKAKGQTGYVPFNNGEWDSELPGFWIAKYEMSMEDGNGNHLNTDNEGGNIDLSSNVKMVSKPNVSSWRSIQMGQIFKNCRNYDNDKNSHMVKNSEWRSSSIFNT